MNTFDTKGYIILKPNLNNPFKHLLISRPDWFETGYNFHAENEVYQVDRHTYSKIHDKVIEKMILAEWFNTTTLSGRNGQGGFSNRTRYFLEPLFVQPIEHHVGQWSQG